MPSTLPDGEPAPADGSLPAQALEGAATRPLGIYLHVPFCATRCGYCDFNTYTATELGGAASQATYVDTALAELDLGRKVLVDDSRPISTVFIGGGTPTLLPATELARLLRGVDERFGLATDAEVTTESNPESVDKAALATLRGAGFTRMSFGMQSAREHVLAVIDRQHTPGRVQEVVRDAKSAGFEHVNVDLIYGTPGETDDDWRASLDAAIESGADHVSAYSLIVEPGTRLSGQVRRGDLPMADEALHNAGLEWYEVSNWARSPAARCRHNLLYWTGGDWWGVGPGAHSHVGGVRWWNVRHPAAYAERLAAGLSPAHAREVLDAETRRVERVLLELRLDEGLPRDVLDEVGLAAVDGQVEDGLVLIEGDRLVLTARGRLLADRVVRAL